MGVSLTVTPCWCYGSETMDMDPTCPRRSGASTAPSGPAPSTWRPSLAGHTQKGLPAFGIYGRDVQDLGDTTIPERRARRRSCASCSAGLAVATMRGKSYLSMGGVSMGIAGSIVDPDFFEDYLGMRIEIVDMSEFVRRIERGHLRQAEYDKALAWVKKNCQEGQD